MAGTVNPQEWLPGTVKPDWYKGQGDDPAYPGDMDLALARLHTFRVGATGTTAWELLEVLGKKAQKADGFSGTNGYFGTLVHGLTELMDAVPHELNNATENAHWHFTMRFHPEMMELYGDPRRDQEAMRREYIGATGADIGKLGFPSAFFSPKLDIFYKGDKHPIRGHVDLGLQILRHFGFPAEPFTLGMNGQDRRYTIVPSFVFQHHERWNGRGYIQGLSGNAIPPEVQIYAVADSGVAVTMREKGTSRNRGFKNFLEDMLNGTDSKGRDHDPELVGRALRALTALTPEHTEKPTP